MGSLPRWRSPHVASPDPGERVAAKALQMSYTGRLAEPRDSENASVRSLAARPGDGALSIVC